MKRPKCKACEKPVVRHILKDKDGKRIVNDDIHCAIHRFQADHDIIANVARRVK